MVSDIWIGGVLMMAAALLPVSAAADPVTECGLRTAPRPDVTECLKTDLAVAEQAMELALEAARQGAEGIDQAIGRTVAVPALTTAQMRWRRFRDANCELRAALATGAAAEEAGLGCAITMTRARTAEFRGLAAAARSGP